MKRSAILLFLTAVGALLVASSGVVLAQASSSSTTGGGPSASSHGRAVRVCSEPVGHDRTACHAMVRTDVPAGVTPPSEGRHSSAGQPTNPSPDATTTTTTAYGPSALRSAYKANPLATLSPGSGPTVAIVDAYDDPNAEKDLAVYRNNYSLGSCTTANGCFRKVNQSGGTSYPVADSGWAQEISLDVDMVSAVCPNCKILLVEAKSNSFSDLLTAVDYAVGHANYVSNSYGGAEFSSETYYDSHFNHSGKVITASAGDNGYGVEYPAASRFVTAVGGTTLSRATNTRGFSEAVWGGTGSGCSAYEQKPNWQTSGSCTHRTVADVAAVADPNTGVWVYDSYQTTGWLVFGGTSVASPIVASVYALAGNASSMTYGSYPYAHASSLFDVISGSNGSCGLSGSSTYYLCNGMTRYDGPTGLGTPNGTGAF